MLRIPILLLLLWSFSSLASPVRVCVLGDSITEGFYPSSRGWSSYLIQMHAGEDFSAKNVSVSGDKVAAAAIVFEREIMGPSLKGCTHVAILIGTNDLPEGTSAAEIYIGIDSIADIAEQAGAKVILLAVLPRGTGAAWSSDLQTRLLALNVLLAARTGSVFVDTYTALLEPASSPPALATAGGGAVDGLHPNNVGQSIIASTIETAVISSGGW